MAVNGEGLIFDIKELSVHDGPGIRTTVFLKGCPLSCRWCHNPEGLSGTVEMRESGPPCRACGWCRQACTHADCQVFGRCLHVCPQGRLSRCGQIVRAEVLAEQIRRQAPLLRQAGGVTLSGGEPLAQAAFLFDLMDRLKPLHLAVETSGHARPEVFQAMTARADLVLVDLKLIDAAAHRQWTGVTNDLILANIGWLVRQDKPALIRIPLIPGVTDTEANLSGSAAFLADVAGSPAALARLQVELLPANPLAGSKYASVGRIWSPGYDERQTPRCDCAPFADRGIACRVL
jgi:pyruvate formate lyase activating enzyme